MAAASRLRLFYLAHFSAPSSDRFLYRLIEQRQVGKIIELGVGDGQRAERMIEVAQRHHPQTATYTGIDLFEARPAGSKGLTLKEAHQRLKSLGVQVRLAPGDPASALARIANQSLETDLLLVRHDQPSESLAGAWFYVPRMLHPDSLVFEETIAQGKVLWRKVSPLEVRQRANQAGKAMRRAA